MLETKEQKQYFTTAIVLIVILGLVTFWSKPNFKYVDTTNSDKGVDKVKLAQAYLDYLATIKTDPAASKELFETILTQEDIRKEVVVTLQADKPVQAPAIDESKIKMSANSDAQAVNNYLTETVGKVYSFNTQTLDINQNLLAATPEQTSQLQADLNTLTNDLYAVKVPPEALSIQKSLLTTLVSYRNLVDASRKYDANDYSQNDSLWPTLYNTYAVANTSALSYTNELNKLTNKYKISEIIVPSSYAKADDTGGGLQLIPTAHAFLGVGDLTITVGDIPRIIMDAVKSGIQASFLQFMGTMLQKLITQIEKNYKIANFLYYSDALINAQYTDDYLDKYATGTGVSLFDRQIIKTFIPQFSCGKQPPNLQQFFQAKAQTYLGFDPDSISPNDPDYYTKLSRVGNFLSSPSGWDVYYQDIASSAQSAAQQSATLELLSSGIKTPRDIKDLNISKSVNSIVSAEKASFDTLLQFGVTNSESIISQVVAKLTQNLINQFVFSGITGNNEPGGSVGVLKEQKFCLDAFQVTPVVGLTDTPYVSDTAPLTIDSAKAIQCSYNSEIDYDCSTYIRNFLHDCSLAYDPVGVDPVVSSRCKQVIGSEYIQAVAKACASAPTLSSCDLPKAANALPFK